MSVDKDTIKKLKAIANNIRYEVIEELISSHPNGLQPTYFLNKFMTTSMNMSFHLSKLENANLVFQKKRGKNVFYFINQKELSALLSLACFRK